MGLAGADPDLLPRSILRRRRLVVRRRPCARGLRWPAVLHGRLVVRPCLLVLRHGRFRCVLVRQVVRPLRLVSPRSRLRLRRRRHVVRRCLVRRGSCRVSFRVRRVVARRRPCARRLLRRLSVPGPGRFRPFRCVLWRRLGPTLCHVRRLQGWFRLGTGLRRRQFRRCCVLRRRSALSPVLLRRLVRRPGLVLRQRRLVLRLGIRRGALGLRHF